MGNVFSLGGKELSNIEVSALTDNMPPSIRQEVGLILHQDVLIGEELEVLISRMKKDVIHLLNAIDDLPVPLERKRAILTIATLCQSIDDIDIPKDFLPNKTQAIRAKAYLLSQAYFSSHSISLFCDSTGDEPGFYNELPNLLFILHSLHDIGISPKDLWSTSPFDSFIIESGRVINQINEGIRRMYIQNTPELQELLGLSIRSVC